MIITYLKLKNWCQHKELQVEFSPRSNGIVGTNGKGKSNLIKAIRVALTGRTDSEDSFESEITHGESSAQIELGFLHDGTPGVIKRKLCRSASNSASLTWGDVKITGISQVNAQLQLMNGISAESMEKYSFIAQDELRSILFDTPTKRMENMIAMIPDISKTRIIRDRVDKFQALIPDITLPYDSEYVATKTAETVASLMVEIGKIQEANKTLETLDKASADATVVAYQQYRANAARKADLERELVEVMKIVETLGAKKTNISSVLSMISCMIPVDFNRKQAEQQLYTFSTFNPAKLTAAQAVLSGTVAREVSSLEDNIVCDTEMLGGLRKELESAKDVVKSGNQAVSVIRKEKERWASVHTSGDACPLCGSSVGEGFFKEHYDQCVKDESEALAHIPVCQLEVDSLMKQVKQLEQSIAATTSRKVMLQNELLSAQSVIDNTVQPEINAEQATTLKQHIATCDSIAGSERELSLLEVQYTAAQERQTRVLTELGKFNNLNVVGEEEFNNANVVNTKFNSCQVSLAVALQLTDNLNKELEKLKLMQAELERVQNSKSEVDAFKTKVAVIRDLLHRDKLPKYALQYHLDSLRKRLSYYLVKFGAPIAVTITDDFDVTFTKNGEAPSPIHRLSGGEKSVVSTALHMSVADRFNGNLRLLVLDEPSQNMDSDYITMLTNIIKTASSGEDGRQLIVVTHHVSEMTGAFHNLITL